MLTNYSNGIELRQFIFPFAVHIYAFIITGIIYIKTDAEMCSRRMKIRNRTGEECVPLDYLKILEEKHDRWLLDRPLIDTDKKWFSVKKDSIIPVLTIDGNVDAYDYKNRGDQLDTIKEFINTEIKTV